MRKITSKLLIVLGSIWATIGGVSNISNAFYSSTIFAYTFVGNIILFMVPGLICVGLGIFIDKRKWKKVILVGVIFVVIILLPFVFIMMRGFIDGWSSTRQRIELQKTKMGVEREGDFY